MFGILVCLSYILMKLLFDLVVLSYEFFLFEQFVIFRRERKKENDFFYMLNYSKLINKLWYVCIIQYYVVMVWKNI